MSSAATAAWSTPICPEWHAARHLLEEARRRTAQAQEKANRARRMTQIATERLQSLHPDAHQICRAALRAAADARLRLQTAAVVFEKARIHGEALPADLAGAVRPHLAEIQLRLERATRATVGVEKSLRQMSGGSERRQRQRALYRAQPGDTLASIADKLGLPLDGLRKANPTTSADATLPLQHPIELPAHGEFPCCEDDSGRTIQVVVHPNDTTTKLAERYRVSIAYLEAKLDDGRLRPGSILELKVADPPL